VDTFFDAARTPAAGRVPYAATLLRGNALTWWQSLSPLQRPTEWEAFKDAIIQYNQPVSSVTVARDKLAQLTQRTSVAAYVKDFKDLALNIPNFSEDERLDRFKRGLKHDVRLHVALANPSSFEQAVTIAGQVDDIMFAHRRGARTEARTSYRTPDISHPTPMELDSITRDKPTTNFKDSRSTSDRRSEELRKGLCFYCKEHGHLAKSCPKKHSGNARDQQ
jgi:hypothetical protein